MENGFLKAACLAPKLKVGDCAYNAEVIFDAAQDAAAGGARLIAFPQLCITSATCGDLFFQSTLLRSATRQLSLLAERTAELDAVIVVGLPYAHFGVLYSCCAVMHAGNILGLVPQARTPKEQARWFSGYQGQTCLTEMLGRPVPFGTGLVFRCATVEDFEFCILPGGTDCLPHNAFSPGGMPPVVVGLSAQGEVLGAAERRIDMARAFTAQHHCAYIHAGAGTGESTTDNAYSGHCIIAECGDILAEAKPFKAETAISEIDMGAIAFLRRKSGYPSCGGEAVSFDMQQKSTALTRQYCKFPFIGNSPQIFRQAIEIQAHGLIKRLEHTGLKAVAIGVSGGLDSTMALVAAVEGFKLAGLDAKDILAYTLPCFGTTETTKTNAYRLCHALGVELAEIDISAAVLRHFEDIGHDPKVHDLCFENAQARERTQVIMDIAGKRDALAIGTGDLSELALGWATYNGDHMSMYGLNASMPKTLIRHVLKGYADACGGELAHVLRDIISTPVSPELLPAKDGKIVQVTEDIVGPYELHDFFIFHVLGRGCSPEKLLRIACHAFRGEYDADTVLKWMEVFFRRFFAQQFKRSCMPDGPDVTGISLSPRGGLSMPSDADYGLWKRQIDAI